MITSAPRVRMTIDTHVVPVPRRKRRRRTEAGIAARLAVFIEISLMTSLPAIPGSEPTSAPT